MNLIRIGLVCALASIVLRLFIQDNTSYLVSCFLFGFVYGTLHGVLGNR